MEYKKLQSFLFGMFLTIVLISAISFFFWENTIPVGEVHQYIREAHILAPVIFITIYIVGTLFIPSTPFMALAGVLFGFEYGLFYCTIGGIISACLTFAISRHLGRTWTESILNHRYMTKLGEYNRRLEKGAVWDLVLIRIAPVMPFNVTNILMGVSRINFKDYVLGTLIGLLPSNIVAVYFGEFVSTLL